MIWGSSLTVLFLPLKRFTRVQNATDRWAAVWEVSWRWILKKLVIELNPVITYTSCVSCVYYTRLYLQATRWCRLVILIIWQHLVNSDSVWSQAFVYRQTFKLIIAFTLLLNVLFVFVTVTLCALITNTFLYSLKLYICRLYYRGCWRVACVKCGFTR